MNRLNANWINWGLLLILGLIWGSSFILIDKGLEGFTPYQMASLRIAISFITISPFIYRHLRIIKSNKILPVLAAALLGNAIPPFLFGIAQTRIESAMTGIINSTTPLFAFIMGILFFGILFNWIKFIGILIGFAGAVFLIAYGAPDTSFESIQYGSLILLATLCYGTSVNVIKKYLQDVHPVTITAVSFSMIGIPAIIYLMLSDFPHRMVTSEISRASFGYISILSVAGTVIASILFYWLTQRTTALFASTVTYLIPIVALMWGFLFNESLSYLHILGMITILGGVYLSTNHAQQFIQRLLKKSPH